MSFQELPSPKYTRKCRLPECGIEFTSVHPFQKFHTTVCTQIFHQRAILAKKRAARAVAQKTPHTLKVSESLNQESTNALNLKWISKPLVHRP